jgi:hypothetical protein
MAFDMLSLPARGGHDMSTTTIRVLVAAVVVACLLAVGALEVVSERVRVDPASTTSQRTPAERPDSSPAYVADFEVREERGPSPAQLSGTVQASRQTVLNVDPAGRRFLALTGTGQVRVSEVSKGALVVTDETQGAGLALLRPGDVIKVEAPHGQIQKIVVLRRGWQELESPEK